MCIIQKILIRRVYYLRIRHFPQILEHVFGSENMKKATIVEGNVLRVTLKLCIFLVMYFFIIFV